MTGVDLLVSAMRKNPGVLIAFSDVKTDEEAIILIKSAITKYNKELEYESNTK